MHSKLLAVACLTCSIGLVGCGGPPPPPPPPGVVYVRTGSPGRKSSEERPAQPSAEHVWIRGHYRWDRVAGAYAWVPGHWQVRPGGLYAVGAGALVSARRRVVLGRRTLGRVTQMRNREYPVGCSR